MPSDLLTFTDFELRTHIGVPDAERADPQSVFVSLEMATDAAAIARTDDVNDSTNYANIYRDIQDVAKTERKTIERLAEDIASLLLHKYTSHATVTVSKKPYMLDDLAKASIRITRSR